MASHDRAAGRPVPSLIVPEIRDYQRINLQIVQWLEEGQRRIRLIGVEGQRLLGAGLRGGWNATIEVEGDAGPELASDLDAPDLRFICSGSAADGAGRGLRAGSVLILGSAGDVLGYGQSGGTLVVAGAVGNRAGLAQSGGVLILGGDVGRFLGDRQSGGLVFVRRGTIGPHAGHGRVGGRLIGPGFEPARTEDMALIESAQRSLAPWLESAQPS